MLSVERFVGRVCCQRSVLSVKLGLGLVDGVDAETSLSLSLHLYLSSPLLHFLLTLTFGLKNSL